MPVRKIRDAADALACLSAADASGLPRAEWARRSRIDPRSLHAWRVNLARGGRLAEGRALEAGAPLRLVELVPALPVAPSAYSIRCREFTIEVDAAFDDGVLRRLLAAVASC